MSSATRTRTLLAKNEPRGGVRAGESGTFFAGPEVIRVIRVIRVEGRASVCVSVLNLLPQPGGER